MTYATTKATDLGKRFDKSTRYFLDMFFQGGAHLVNHQNKLNAFNAFKAEKAAERREGTCFFNDVLRCSRANYSKRGLPGSKPRVCMTCTRTNTMC
jgi:hypothetical protein